MSNLFAADAPKADDTTQAINKLLADSWRENGLKPAEPTGDAEFARRVYLDLVGRIPRVAEVQAFEKDGAGKRARLVDRLLDSPEYVEYWADVWTNWLVGRAAPAYYQDQLRLWVEEEALRNKWSTKDLVAKLLTATGRSNDNGGVVFVGAQVGKATGVGLSPPQTQAVREKEGQHDMLPVTLRTARLFLGYRLDGLDIPDHEPEGSDWTAKDLWGLNIFFRQVELRTEPQKQNKTLPPVLYLTDNETYNQKAVLFYAKANGAALPAEAVFLDGRKLPKEGKASRRQVLADFVTSHENFAKAHVNRMWGHFFGRGLHERPAVDDFCKRNKVVHPQLLDRLARDFTAGGHDAKKLIRWICSSDAYQLRSAGNETNTKPETERYFSRMPLKLLSPEQLMNSTLLLIRPDPKSDPESQSKLRAQLRRLLRPRGADSDWEDLAFHDKVIQAMAFVNRREVSDLVLEAEASPVARAAREKDPVKGVELLYLTALGRAPTDREVDQVRAELKKAAEAGDKNIKALWQDLFWALLNSSEFVLNH